ncbi:MAG: glucosaminidase domain-containing protein [Chitinophagales bacterium]
MKTMIGSLLLLTCLIGRAQTMPEGWAYIEKYRDVAITEMNRSGVPASITLAQGLHESAFGKSPLATNANNHFGIKCHNEWSGDRYHHDDDAPQECFRVYKSAEESFADHSDFLKTRKHYAKLFTLNITDYRGWARGLKAAGYATNPKYPEIIIKLIEDYQLSNLDKLYNLPEQPAAPAVAQAPASAKPVAPSRVNITPAKVVTIDELIQSSPQWTPDMPMVERRVNGLKAVVYKEGMKAQDIASRYKISLDQLFAYNDLKPGMPFTPNLPVYVEEKKTECPSYQYEVAEGETMHAVSQKFGIKLSELCKRNNITMNCEPLPGEVVVLRGSREVPMRFKVRAQASDTKAEAPATHRVGEEETLFSISQRYNMDVDSLKRINNLTTNDIQIGQTLVVEGE